MDINLSSSLKNPTGGPRGSKNGPKTDLLNKVALTIECYVKNHKLDVGWKLRATALAKTIIAGSSIKPSDRITPEMRQLVSDWIDAARASSPPMKTRATKTKSRKKKRKKR